MQRLPSFARQASVAEVCDLGLRAGSRGRRPASQRPATDRPATDRPATERWPATARRSGISLLEVLISIFVLVVGILGLAALIPIGRFDVQEAGKIDRGAALGKQAQRELRLRGLLDARNEWLWFDETANAFKPVLDPATLQFHPQFMAKFTPPFAIDPMMFADPRNYDAVWGSPPPDTPSPHTFPYNVDSDASNAGLTNVPRIARLSLNQFMPIAGTTADYDNWTDPQQQLSAALCNRVFQGRDDLSFFLPDDKDNRPVQKFSILNVPGDPPDDFIKQTPSKRLAPMTLGEYSWMVTVSPALGELYDWSTLAYSPERMRTYVVSVVVFHKRPITLLPPSDNEAPAERTVAVEFTGSGIGGGSVHLESDAPNYLRDLRPNQWILLMARHNVANVPPNQSPVIAKWYRIVAVDDGSRPDHREVTLDGPDWLTTPNALVSLGTGDENEPIYATAAIFDGVVAVYDKTMQLDLTGN